MENNSLIAEFVGIKKSLNVPGAYEFRFSGTFHPHELKYDTSWDWLKPVIDQICDISIENPGELNKLAAEVGNGPICNSLEVHYNRVVKFIKYLNEHPEEHRF